MDTEADSADPRELRLGLVMTGGVSLAVWMGGVAAEIYRCIKGDGLYGDLAELTDTKVIVDVMSGASAGGLNGAFLGTAIAYGLEIEEFDELRSLWLEVGSFSKLLRNPLKKDPPSLLQGDEFFTLKIEEILTKWINAKKGKCVLPAGQKNLTVILTTSLLSAELERFTDDFDTEILEPNHRATFTFQADEFNESATLPARLALAARTTASFPGAFEASYIPIGESKPDTVGLSISRAARRRDGRPDMDGIASFPRSHWAVDGGVLVNKPVGPALDAILKRSSKSEVRRVVAYVNPDPGSPRQEIDVEAAAPTIGDVVLKSVVSLPRAESIADHLEELREVNQRNSDKRDLRDSLLRGVRVGPPVAGGPRRQIDVPAIATEIYPYWIKQRSTQAVDNRLEAHFIRARIDQTQALSTETGKAPVTFRELRHALEQTRGEREWLASDMPIAGATTADAATRGVINLSDDGVIWRWGFQPLGYIADLALDLIHQTFGLLPLQGDDAKEVRSKLGVLRERVHRQRGFLNVLRSADDDYWADSLATLAIERGEIIDCAPKLADYLYAGWPVPPATVWKLDQRPASTGDGSAALSAADRDRLKVWRRFVDLVVGEADVAKPESTGKAAATEPPPDAATHSPTLVEILRSLDGNQIESPANTPLAKDLAARTRVVEMRIAWELTRIVRDLGAQMAAAVGIYRNWVGEPKQLDPCDVPVTDPAVALLQIGHRLGVIVGNRGPNGAQPTGDHQELAPLLLQLLGVYVVHSCTVANIKETPRLELIQVSALCRNRVTPDRYLPEQKVAGLQVGHFGGFLKESWRANDWMWGAMDGAERIIAMLIDPARLRQRFATASQAMDALCPILTGRGRLESQLHQSELDFLRKQWARREHDILEELTLLYTRSGTALPRRLENLCEMASYVAQLVIGKRQLPVVAQAVTNSAAAGGCESAQAIEFVEAVRQRLGPDDRRASAVHAPHRRLSIVDVGVLLDKCRVGMEKASSELSSDLGAATAAKAAAVAGTAVSGTRGGLGPLSLPAKSLRTGVLGVYFTTSAALRKTRIGVAVTFLLLAIGAGAVSARLLGAAVPSPVLVMAIVLLAFWLLYTGASAKAYWTSIVGALVLGVVALSFIDRDSVCGTFADQGCPGAQAGWKDTVPKIVVALFIVAALSCFVTCLRYLLDHSIEENLQQLGSPMPKPRPTMNSVLHSKPTRNDLKSSATRAAKGKALKPFVAAWVLLFFAWAYPVLIHPSLFEGAAEDDVEAPVRKLVAIVIGAVALLVLGAALVSKQRRKHLTARRIIVVTVLAAAAIVTFVAIDRSVIIRLERGDVIRWVTTLSDNRPAATLIGIPAVFIALEYARTQYQIVHSKLAHRNALARLRKGSAATRKQRVAVRGQRQHGARGRDRSLPHRCHGPANPSQVSGSVSRWRNVRLHY